MQIFHNPRCRKSRETLALLQENGQDPDVFLYLEEKLTQKRLKEVLSMLDMPAASLVMLHPDQRVLSPGTFSSGVTASLSWAVVASQWLPG